MKPLAVLALVALVLAGPWLHSDKVICVKSNSHVRVELVDADCCRQGAVPVSGALMVNISDPDCGACTDMQVTQHAAQLALGPLVASSQVVLTANCAVEYASLFPGMAPLNDCIVAFPNSSQYDPSSIFRFSTVSRC